MCLKIIFTLLCIVAQLSFNFFLSSSSHGSNPSSYCHHRLPSHPCRCLIFHRFSLTSWTEHMLKHPLQVEVHIIMFPTSHHSHEMGSEQESCAYFTLSTQSVQSWFQTAQRSMFLPYLLVRVFKIDDPWCIGNRVWRSLWILTFLPLYTTEHVLKSWWKQRLPSQAL
jgi:hypothetical protein